MDDNNIRELDMEQQDTDGIAKREIGRAHV